MKNNNANTISYQEDKKESIVNDIANELNVDRNNIHVTNMDDDMDLLKVNINDDAYIVQVKDGKIEKMVRTEVHE